MLATFAPARPAPAPRVLRNPTESARERPPDPGRSPRAPTRQRYGVLIVDDEEAILESLELTLDDDYRVFTALTGKQGLEILEREDVALVIVDQVMPDMSGVEFLEKVVERRPHTVA